MRRIKCKFCDGYFPKFIEGKLVKDITSHMKESHEDELSLQEREVVYDED